MEFELRKPTCPVILVLRTQSSNKDMYFSMHMTYNCVVILRAEILSDTQKRGEPTILVEDDCVVVAFMFLELE